MINLLKISRLKFEGVSRFCCIQEMESVHPIVVRIIIIRDGVFDPAMSDKSITHILILSQNSEDLFRWVKLGILFPESLNGLICSHIDLLLGEVLNLALLIVYQLKNLLHLIF